MFESLYDTGIIFVRIRLFRTDTVQALQLAYRQLKGLYRVSSILIYNCAVVSNKGV
jgi:hypothetical protein